MWYNIIKAVAGQFETNTIKALLPGTDVLVYLVADPKTLVSGNCYQPLVISTSAPDNGAFVFLRDLGVFYFMSTSRLQRYVSQRLSIHLGHHTIRENFRPDWLINPDGAHLELDFYIEEIKTAIEVQGEQHYRYCKFFHRNYDDFLVRLARDKWKRIQCQSLGIKFIEIASRHEADLVITDLTEEKKKSKKLSSRNEVYDMLSEIPLGKNHTSSNFRKKKQVFKLIANTLKRLEIDGKPLNEKRRYNLQSAIRSVAGWIKQGRDLTDEECVIIHLASLTLEAQEMKSND